MKTAPPSTSILSRRILMLGSRSLVAIAALVMTLAPSHAAVAGEPIWSIGTPDGSPIEFAPGARNQLTFTVGQSVPSRDFAGHHPGSVGFDPAGAGEKPYTIVFDLNEAPTGAYQLVLDLIYRSGAPEKIKVKVNDKVGLFPIRPSPKKDIDGEEGNAMLLAGQHLVVPIDAAWLKPKGNHIVLAPLGVGGLDYDALTFERAGTDLAATGARLRVEPTVFFRKTNGKLVEICQLLVPFHQRFANGTATIQLGRQRVSHSFNSADCDFGLLAEPVELPAITQPTEAAIDLTLDGQSQHTTHEFRPAKQWKVYICPKVHNDVGYTDLQPHVNELDNRNTDTVLDILARYPFYKFNFETAWLVDNYLDCRTPFYRQLFFSWAAKGRATLNALYLNLMTGVCSGEELYRAMYFTQRLHREHGSNFDFACLTDAPSHTWFLPSLLSDVGIKAFSNGSNQTRAPILHFSDLNENSPYYWEGMNGERIFMWYARSYTQWKRLTGPDFLNRAASLDYLKASVPQFLTRFLRADYVPDAVMIYGAYVDNAAIPKTGEAELVEQWNQQYEFPKLVVASDAEYFGYIDKHFAGRLPVYRGDCGAYWEDGVASSAAATTLNRLTHDILPAAETTAALATIFEPRNRYPAEDFWSAWRNVMFYDEHTWGAHNSVSQPDREFVTRQWEIKESYAKRANLDARNLLARAFNRLCQEIAVDGDTVFAFNWQNWPRTAPIEVEIDQSRYLVDLATGKPVPLDVILEKDGWRRVRLLAKDVPPMGYRGYALRSLNPPATKPNEKIASETIESQFYRLTIDPQSGGIKSLYDKTDHRELADAQAPYKLNEYLYVTGGENSLILNLTFGTPPANLQIETPVSARIVENRKTPLGQRIIVVAQAKNTPKIRSEYLVYDQIRRVDIVNTVEKEPTRRKEAVYFAFPFAAQQPALEYQIQNGWVRPNEDQLPGACREWFTPQNLVHLRDGTFSVAWSTPDAPLVCLTDINRGKWPAHLPITNGHVYSYVMHNYWFTNYRAEQGGVFTFRYSITSGQGLDREQLARFDADTRTPVLAYPFISSFSAGVADVSRPLAPAAGSFFTLDAANLQMVTLKAAEDGDGYIVRVREIAGRTGEAELRCPTLRVKSAWLCNGVEVNKRKLAATSTAVTVPYTPNQYVTLRIKAEGAIQKNAAK
ncbi:MAG: glycoside hydrolase family 38 N-terminal domain-containing protein [Limisphaerales bacterium]